MVCGKKGLALGSFAKQQGIITAGPRSAALRGLSCGLDCPCGFGPSMRVWGGPWHGVPGGRTPRRPCSTTSMLYIVLCTNEVHIHVVCYVVCTRLYMYNIEVLHISSLYYVHMYEPFPRVLVMDVAVHTCIVLTIVR